MVIFPELTFQQSVCMGTQEKKCRRRFQPSLIIGFQLRGQLCGGHHYYYWLHDHASTRLEQLPDGQLGGPMSMAQLPGFEPTVPRFQSKRLTTSATKTLTWSISSSSISGCSYKSDEKKRGRVSPLR